MMEGGLIVLVVAGTMALIPLIVLPITRVDRNHPRRAHGSEGISLVPRDTENPRRNAKPYPAIYSVGWARELPRIKEIIQRDARQAEERKQEVTRVVEGLPITRGDFSPKLLDTADSVALGVVDGMNGVCDDRLVAANWLYSLLRAGATDDLDDRGVDPTILALVRDVQFLESLTVPQWCHLYAKVSPLGAPSDEPVRATEQAPALRTRYRPAFDVAFSNGLHDELTLGPSEGDPKAPFFMWYPGRKPVLWPWSMVPRLRLGPDVSREDLMVFFTEDGASAPDQIGIARSIAISTLRGVNDRWVGPVLPLIDKTTRDVIAQVGWVDPTMIAVCWLTPVLRERKIGRSRLPRLGVSRDVLAVLDGVLALKGLPAVDHTPGEFKRMVGDDARRYRANMVKRAALDSWAAMSR
jgi:hypothetical protein